MKHGADKPVVTDLIAMPEHHRRNLRIEQWQRKLSHFLDEDFQILMRRVKHFGDAGVCKKAPERRQFDVRRQRVDGGGGRSVANLDQAKLRVVGLLAHEFRIDCEELGAMQLRDKRFELGSGGDHVLAWCGVGGRGAAAASCHEISILSFSFDVI